LLLVPPLSSPTTTGTPALPTETASRRHEV